MNSFLSLNLLFDIKRCVSPSINQKMDLASGQYLDLYRNWFTAFPFGFQSFLLYKGHTGSVVWIARFNLHLTFDMVTVVARGGHKAVDASGTTAHMMLLCKLVGENGKDEETTVH